MNLQPVFLPNHPTFKYEYLCFSSSVNVEDISSRLLRDGILPRCDEIFSYERSKVEWKLDARIDKRKSNHRLEHLWVISCHLSHNEARKWDETQHTNACCFHPSSWRGRWVICPYKQPLDTLNRQFILNLPSSDLLIFPSLTGRRWMIVIFVLSNLSVVVGLCSKRNKLSILLSVTLLLRFSRV